MNVTRPYRMTQRREMVEETRERILQAGYAAWLDRPYDQVTLDSVAEAAGVSRQTVIRHFGSKDDLALAIVAWQRPIEEEARAADPGDTVTAVHRLVDRYETMGDANVRLLELEGRVPPVDRLLSEARSSHRGWIERTFAPWLTGCRGARREDWSWRSTRPQTSPSGSCSGAIWDLPVPVPSRSSANSSRVRWARSPSPPTRRAREHASSLPDADVGGRRNDPARARRRPAARGPRAFRPRPRRSDHPRAGGGGGVLLLALAAGTAPHGPRPGSGPHEGLGDEQPARHAGAVARSLRGRPGRGLRG